MDVCVMARPPPPPQPPSVPVPDGGGGGGERPRRSPPSRHRRLRRRPRKDKAASREAAVAAAAAADAFDDAATAIHPWAPTWSPSPVHHLKDKVSKSASAPHASAVSAAREAWQGQGQRRSGAGGGGTRKKLGPLEEAVVAACGREVDWLRKNNNAGPLQVSCLFSSCFSPTRRVHGTAVSYRFIL